MLNLVRTLLSLRRVEPALAVGSYSPVETTDALLAYAREHDGRRFLVALNLGHDPLVFKDRRARGRLVLSTRLDRESEAHYAR